jgi:hypothetical protein
VAGLAAWNAGGLRFCHTLMCATAGRPSCVNAGREAERLGARDSRPSAMPAWKPALHVHCFLGSSKLVAWRPSHPAVGGGRRWALPAYEIGVGFEYVRAAHRLAAAIWMAALSVRQLHCFVGAWALECLGPALHHNCCCCAI